MEEVMSLRGKVIVVTGAAQGARYMTPGAIASGPLN
jgi:hypothetical protein